MITNAGYAVINYGFFDCTMLPQRRIVIIVFHSAGAADRQQTLAVQRPGQVAAVTLRAAGAACNNI